VTAIDIPGQESPLPPQHILKVPHGSSGFQAMPAANKKLMKEKKYGLMEESS
jgi:hypothetical protein